jgi:hypothetical protein
MATSRRNVFIRIGVALLLLAVAGYFSWNYLSLKYHRYQMTANYTRSVKFGPSHPRHSDFIHSYEQHRKALLDRGYFVKQQFYLKNLTTRSPKFQQLTRDLQQEFPIQISKLEAHGYIYGEPTFLILWIDPTSAKAIEDLIQQHDKN